jgi:hypothetical protein
MPMKPLTVGFFGLWGKEKVNEQVVGSDPTEYVSHKNDINVYGYGAYAFVPLLKSTDGKSRAMTLSLETQAYVAAGLDVIGATARNAVGSPNDPDAAKGYGVSGQFIFYPIQPLGITVGYGRRNILDSSDYSGAAEKYNEQYFGNVAYDLNSAVRVAAEYQRLKTSYLNDTSGKANRFMVSAMYFF